MDVHTTQSWQFLGLERGNEIPPDSAWNKGRFGEDVIIGGVDSGRILHTLTLDESELFTLTKLNLKSFCYNERCLA